MEDGDARDANLGRVEFMTFVKGNRDENLLFPQLFKYPFIVSRAL